jgi:hypothetical protein
MAPTVEQLRNHLGPKIAPRWAIDGSQQAPRWPKMAPRGPNMAATGPKMAPRWPKMAPKGPKTCLLNFGSIGVRPQEGPQSAQDGPKRPQHGPKMAQESRKRPQDGPQGALLGSRHRLAKGFANRCRAISETQSGHALRARGWVESNSIDFLLDGALDVSSFSETHHQELINMELWAGMSPCSGPKTWDI